MPQKKAFIDIQTNWIFIIIAGGIILTFFFMVIGKQKEVSETKISQTISVDLSSIFTSAKVTTGSATLIKIPNVEINYDCTGYRVGSGSKVRQQVAFSPSLIKGHTLMAWTLDWSMPFRVVNFQYITTPNMRYIFVDADGHPSNSDPADIIFDALPDEKITERGEEKTLFNKWKLTYTELADVEDLNNYKVRIVYFEAHNSQKVPVNLQSMEDKDLTALFVDGEVDGVGTIHFYKKNGNVWAEDKGSESGTEKTFYIGTASLLGAIFSDNIDTYNCNMKNAYIALDKVSEIYSERATKLKEHYLSGSACATSLPLAKNNIETIKDKNKPFTLITSPGDNLNLNNILTASIELASRNQNLQRLSCAEVY